MEFSFELSTGLAVHGRIDSSLPETRGVVIIIHGLGEHLGRYDDWTARFAREGFTIIRADLPGHGRSEGKRGHISSFDLLSELINLQVEMAVKDFPGVPIVLYGHSLGGTIVLNHLISGFEGIDLSVVSSPWLKLSFEPPRSKMILARAVKNILPSLVQPTGLVAEHLSHDNDVVRRYVEDPLVHSGISVALFTGVHGAARNILERGSELKIPLLLLHGREDLITSPGASSEVARLSPNVKLKLWDGGFHELHNETFRDEVFTDIISWLNSKL